MIQRILDESMDVATAAPVTDGAVIGDYQFQLDPVHGAMLSLASGQDQSVPRPRPTPVVQRPAMSEGFVNRPGETGQARAALKAGECLEFHGPEGSGKTALLVYLAHHVPLDDFPDGIVYRRVSGYSERDIRQLLFESFYASDVACRPSEEQVRQALQRKQALILLDDADLEPRGLESLMNGLPRSALVIAVPSPRLQDEGPSMALSGLSLGEAVTLLEQELGERPLAAAELPDAQQLCRALGRQPLRIRQAAALMREDGYSLEQLAGKLASDEDFVGLMLDSIKHLSAAQQEILGALTALQGVAIAADRLAKISGLPNVREVLDSLRQRALVEEVQDRYRLCGDWTEAIRKKVSPEWTIKLILYYRHLAERHRNAPDRLLPDQEALLQILQWVRQARLWADALAIARRLEGVLALAGRWDAWGQVLEWAQEAARKLDDRRGEAWVLHEQGVRALCLNHAHSARKLLATALRMRELQGDTSGAEATRLNLKVAENAAAAGGPVSAPSRRRTPMPRAIRVALGLALVLLAGWGGVMLLGPHGVFRQPSAPPAPIQLASFSVPAAEIAGGQNVTATIRLNRQVPHPGAGVDSASRAVIEIVAEAPDMVSVPRTVGLLSGQSEATFPIETKPVAKTRRTKITAVYAGLGQEIMLTLRPELRLELDGSSAFGNRIVDGRVWSKAKAPAGGLRVPLACSNPSAVQVPPAATIPEGEQTGAFEVQTLGVSSPQKVDITATSGDLTRTCTLTVQPGTGWVLIPPSVVGGRPAAATVILGHPAPAGGTLVRLSSSEPGLLQVPENVMVAAGKMYAELEVNTAPVGRSEAVTMTVEREGVSDRVHVKLRPQVEFTISAPDPETGIVRGIIQLAVPPPADAWAYVEHEKDLVITPARVRIAAGQSTATFPIAVGRSPVSRRAEIVVSYEGVVRRASATVTGAVELSLHANEVPGGEAIAGRFALNGTPPNQKAKVYLTLSPRGVAEAPESLDVPSGSRAVDFAIRTRPVPANRDVVLTANYQGIQHEAKFTVRAQLALRLDSAEIVGGAAARVTVDLGVAAPEGGAAVKLDSSHPSAAAVPPEITVPKGARTARFVVNTQPVGRTENVILRAHRGSLTGQAAVRVQPEFDLQLQQAHLVGGQSTEGRLALRGPAPPGGAKFDLASSDPEILSVPSTVVIPAGGHDGSFEVRTAAVPDQRQPAVTARYENREESLPVTLQPDFELTVVGDGLTRDGMPQGTIRLNGPAPDGGTVIALKSNAANVANVPAEVIVPAGASSVNFPIQLSAGERPQTVVLVASHAGVRRKVVLTVQAPNSVSIAVDPAAGTQPQGGRADRSSSSPVPEPATADRAAFEGLPSS